MRGITKGDQSTTLRPILQFFCRSGGFLSDIYSGSFIIEDIHSASVATTTPVTTTSFTAVHKLGTGRYVIPTGATTTWNLGTHRAICTYKTVSGGPDYKQVIEFEVLDSTDWPSGDNYLGYLSTRLAYQDGYASLSYTAQTLHRHLSRISRLIENVTGRFFEPRYLTLRKSGQQAPDLLLQEAIIALEDIYAIWQTSTGDDTYKYEQYLYKVFNRHLDGFLEDDDRLCPKVTLTNVDGEVVTVEDYIWPFGTQNIQFRGVFGYTDPEFDPAGGRVLIGQTPKDIAHVSGVLLSRYLEDPTMGSLATFSPGSIRSMRTRDQSVTFGGSSGDASSSELLGDPLLDAILVKYLAPMAFGAV